jgi:hypothetical protein
VGDTGATGASVGQAESVEAAGAAVAARSGGRQHAHLAGVVPLEEVLQSVPTAAHAHHHVPTLKKLRKKSVLFINLVVNLHVSGLLCTFALKFIFYLSVYVYGS